jgi:stage V sporulation protein D (sporulation-specific penicillin-binding protein)
MQKKLLVLFFIILAAFVCLVIRLYKIAHENGEAYKKQVLSQQTYDSVTIPYRRGNIYDSNGLVLSCSDKVYNVILDSYLLLSDEKYLKPTLSAAKSALGIDPDKISTYIKEHPSSRYYILAKKKTYDQVKKFQDLTDDSEKNPNVKGIWLEEQYQRKYPNDSLAASVIGFTTSDNVGTSGLEEYYNDTLNGTNGREYGYMNSDSDLERTTIPAEDGDSLITTIDSNVQSIVEDKLKEFNDEYAGAVHDGNGAEHVGCIIMEVNSGDVIAMADYPTFNLNEPRNTEALIGAREVDSAGNKTDGTTEINKIVSSTGTDESTDTKDQNADNSDGSNSDGANADKTADNSDAEKSSDTTEKSDTTDGDAASGTDNKGAGYIAPLYVTKDSIDQMDDDTLYQNLNSLWKNQCISSSYEPGSVAKPFTVAAALDSGSITGNETYDCEGHLDVGGWPIYCHNRNGDGVLSVGEAIERSCNVCLMQIAFATGKDEFIRYQGNFGFGYKTNIDLAGESRTANLVYDADNMGLTELATNSFGQGFNVTMIQTITGFCSLINGGDYYEPHVVSKIVSSDGATIQNVEPRVLKQTISSSTSKKIITYCNQVVTGEHGTGKTARPAGYMIGGKTGTAETLPRGNGQYVVSFMGYAPADDPKYAIYVVVDRPNSVAQDDAKYATKIVRSILTEMLPYEHIYMTEPLSDDEKAELAAADITAVYQNGSDTATVSGNSSGDDSGQSADQSGDQSVNKSDAQNADQSADKSDAQNADQSADKTSDQEGQAGQDGAAEDEEIWKTYPIDAATGYAIDPNTGGYIDPNTGASIGVSVLPSEDENGKVQTTPSGGSDGSASQSGKDSAAGADNAN